MNTTYPSSTDNLSNDQIATRAYEVYLDRIEKNIPGDSDTDWLQAETLLVAEIEDKALKKAPQQARPARTVKARLTNSEDLKHIKGVGPSFIKKLNAEGITKVSQIAAMSQSDVEQLENKLNCKGRITRENWIEQARKLAKI